MTYAVAQETRGEWVNALAEGCTREQLPYRLVEMARNDWESQLEGCRALLWRAHMGDPATLRDARTKIPLAEAKGIRCFPSARMLWLYDDKVRQAWFFRQHAVPTPRTFVSRDLAESLDFVSHASFPLVFKTPGGASSNGVYLVRSRNEASQLVCAVLGPPTRTWVQAFSTRLQRKLRRHLGRPDTSRRLTRHDIARQGIDTVYLQEYIEDDGDWRITTFGRNIVSVFRRVNRPGDFRASGSGRWKKPTADELPHKACNYALDFSDEHGFSCMAYDVFVRDGGFLIGEISYTILLNDIYANTLFRRASDGSYEPMKPNPIGDMHLRALREIDQ